MPSKLDSLNELIESDEQTAKDFRYLKFTEGVINGRIAVVESEENADKHKKAKKVANSAVSNVKRAEKAAQQADFANYVRKISKKAH